LLFSTVFSCSFSSTAIADDDEKNLNAGSRIAGMSSKTDLFFYDFFLMMKRFRGILVIATSFFEKLENRKVE